MPFAVKTLYDSFYPDVYMGPYMSYLRKSLYGFCNIENDITQVYRRDSLEYIDAKSIMTSDQAQQYLPSISMAYQAYLTSLDNNFYMTHTVIRSLENLVISQNYIVTRIYYQVYANTTQPLTAFNYQLRYSRNAAQQRIKSTSDSQPVLSAVKRRRSVQTPQEASDEINDDKHRLLVKRAIKSDDNDLILDWLPQVTLESEITVQNTGRLVNSLVKFWNKSKLKGSINNIKMIKWIDKTLYCAT